MSKNVAVAAARDEKKSRVDRILDSIERAGNALPHPFILFMILSGIILVLSLVMSRAGVSVTALSATNGGSETAETVFTIQNLVTKDYLLNLVINFPQTFISFGPLKTALVVIISIAVAERSGLLSAFVRRVLLGASPTWMMLIIAFIAVNGNLLADVAVVVLPPLSGAIFAAMGFNPWLGITLSYIGATAANSASIVITSTDINLAAVTQQITGNLGINAPVNPLMNWYFIMASTFVITITMVVVSKTIMKNKLPLRDPNANLTGGGSTRISDSQLTPAELKGLRAAGIFSLVYFALLAVMTIPSGGILRSPEGTILPASPFLNGLVMIITLYFIFAGIIYGKVSGGLKSLQDLPDMMAKGITDVSGFIVIILSASIMIQVFSDSHIGDMIGAAGGQFLKDFNIGPTAALVGLILITMFSNLFVISGLTKWLLFAPVFIPLFASIGVSPAVIQMTYRIGDAITNSICPMNAMLGAIIGYYTLWKPKGYGKVGLGTIMVLALPYTMAIAVMLILQFLVWMLFGLPLGPGAGAFM